MVARRVHAIIWYNGSTIDCDQFRIDVRDPALLYGLGLFETTRTHNGRPWLWDAHLQRIRESASVLGLRVDAIELPDAEQVCQFVRQIGDADCVVRLNVAAGVDGETPLVWMVTRPLIEPIDPYRLQLCPWRISRSDPLSSLKCFNYGTRVLAHHKAKQAGFDGALLVSTDELLLDATFANLFVRIGGHWCTPPLAGGVLPGTVRTLLLELQPIPIEQRALSVAELPSIQEAFLTNSGSGVVAVSRIDDHAIPSHSATTIQQWLMKIDH